jgi:HlyD family secretion protein
MPATARSVLTLIVLALSLLACRTDETDGRIIATGHVEATEVRLSTKVGGTLLTRTVDEGDAVQDGLEIARIDTVDLELELAAARAERAQADADLRLKRAGYRQEEVAEAEAMVVQAEADLDLARKDFDRMEALLASGSGTTKSRDDAMARRDVAQARLRAAREQLRKLRAGFRTEEIDVAAARLAAAEARIAQLEQKIRDAVIVSPTAGIVTAKIAEPGELLGPGAPIVVVTDLANAWLNVYVGEPNLGKIRLGQPAEVRTDGGEVRTGRVSFIASQAEFTPKNVQTQDERVKLVFKVKIALDNRDGLFKPGMPAQAVLEPASPVAAGETSG